MDFKKLIFNTFYFGRCGGPQRNSVLTVSTLGRCGGLQKTHF